MMIADLRIIVYINRGVLHFMPLTYCKRALAEGLYIQQW